MPACIDPLTIVSGCIWPFSVCCNWQLWAVPCRSWLRSVLVNSDAIGDQIECKGVAKWSAISHAIPIGIPTKNQTRHYCYKSIGYRTDSTYPGPPNRQKRRPWTSFLCLEFTARRNKTSDGLKVSQRLRVLARNTQKGLCRTGRSPTTLLPILQRTQADSQQLCKCTLGYTNFSPGLSRSQKRHLGFAGRLASFHLAYRSQPDDELPNLLKHQKQVSPL